MVPRIIAGLLCLGIFLAAPISSADQRNTIVFISDLHLNINADYSWMRSHVDKLKDFLWDLNARPDVNELVILGDLVDDWVAPAEASPHSFQDVLEDPINSDVVAALQAICRNRRIRVTYVVGNHDMLLFENMAVITGKFPEMHIISDDQGLGVYARDDVIWAEHGHRYCLFNAPDTWSREGGHLPMGYFITRLAATHAFGTGEVVTTPDLLDRYLKASPESLAAGEGGVPFSGSEGEVGGAFDDLLVFTVFNAIAIWSGLDPLVGPIIMDGVDGYYPDPSVPDIAVTYDAIYSKWPVRQDRVSQVEAVFNDLGALNSAANLIFEMPDFLKDKYLFTPRIILFGHTHEAAFQYHSGKVDTIYVNTGTWIDKKEDMTWAEIEINDSDNGKRMYEVSLWFYDEASPRHTGTIAVELPSQPKPKDKWRSWKRKVYKRYLKKRFRLPNRKHKGANDAFLFR